MMDAEQARDRFSDALEDGLDDAERAQFEQALERDPELRAEFEAFEATVRQTRSLGRDRPRVDLVAGVHDRLHRRSRGRYYRDRFARRRPGQLAVPLVLTALTLGLILAAWWITQGSLP